MNAKLVRLAVLLTFALGASTGCDFAGTDRSGESIAAAEVEHLPVEELAVKWVLSDPILERPNRLAILRDGRLVVADRTRVHFISSSGGVEESVGRYGEGPQEYQEITMVQAIGDSVAILDGALYRVTFMSPTGSFLGSARLSPPTDAPVPAARPFLFRGDSIFIWWQNGMVDVHGGTPDRYVLYRADLSDGAHEPILEREGWSWVAAPRIAVPRDPYGPTVMSGVTDRGELVVGDGVEYCYQVSAASEWNPRTICREWDRPSIRKIERVEIPAGVDVQAALRELLAEKHLYQESTGLRNSYDRLLVDPAGCAWIRVAEPNQPYDPIVMNIVRDLRPPTFLWEVFRIADGRPVGRYRVESWIDLLAVRHGVAVGIGELPSGELAVVRMSGAAGRICEQGT